MAVSLDQVPIFSFYNTIIQVCQKDFKIAIIKKQVKDIASSAVNASPTPKPAPTLRSAPPHAMADPSEVQLPDHSFDDFSILFHWKTYGGPWAYQSESGKGNTTYLVAGTANITQKEDKRNAAL